MIRETPESAAEAARLLAACGAAGRAVLPRGGGTKTLFGRPPVRADVVLETRALAGIVEHEPADMVCTVRAGTPFAELQRVLSEQGQRVPLDPPHAAATVGGVVATASAGPRRARFGAPRDLLLGIEVALADGGVARGGGRVVKNVTGYDLMKLHAGALGTLGLVTEVSLRLRPLARDEAGASAIFTTPDAALRALDRLRSAPIELAYATALGPDPSRFLPLPAGPWCVVAAFDGPARARQRAELVVREACGAPGASDVTALGSSDVTALDRALAQVGDALSTGKPAAARGRVAVLPTAWSSAVAATSKGHDGDLFWEARAGAHGIVHVSAPNDGALAAACRAVRTGVGACAGLVTWELLPREVAARVDPWPDARDALPLLRAIKAQLDPGSVLNPGRFIGGI